MLPMGGSLAPLPTPLVLWCCTHGHTRLESDIACLEQHLEGMRATYALNTEKLEYNYRQGRERRDGPTSALASTSWGGGVPRPGRASGDRATRQ
jgi:hypothetical protein